MFFPAQPPQPRPTLRRTAEDDARMARAILRIGRHTHPLARCALPQYTDASMTENLSPLVILTPVRHAAVTEGFLPAAHRLGLPVVLLTDHRLEHLEYFGTE